MPVDAISHITKCKALRSSASCLQVQLSTDANGFSAATWTMQWLWIVNGLTWIVDELIQQNRVGYRGWYLPRCPDSSTKFQPLEHEVYELQELKVHVSSASGAIYPVDGSNFFEDVCQIAKPTSGESEMRTSKSTRAQLQITGFDSQGIFSALT